MVIPALTNAVFVTCFTLWVLPWTSEFHVARGTVMIAFAIGNLVQGVTSPLVARSLERVPTRVSVTLGALALILGLLLESLSQSILQAGVLYATLIAVGAAFTGLLPAQSVAVRILPHKAGTISGFITLSMSIGSIVMPAILVGPIASLGWRPAIAIAAVILLVTVAPASWFLLKGHDGGPVAGGHGAHGGHGAAPGTPDVSTDLSKLTVGALLGKLAFWVPLFAIVPVLFVVGTVLTNVVAIAADNGFSSGVGGYLVPMIGLGGAFGGVVLGWLVDRIDYRLVFAGAATAVVLALGLLLVRPGLVEMALAFGVFGFAGAGAFPVLGAMLVRSFGTQAFARIMGVMMPVLVIEMAVAPLIAAKFRDMTGSYRIAFMYCTVLMVASALAVVTLRIAPARTHSLAADLPGRA
jgi:MFS family permease